MAHGTKKQQERYKWLEKQIEVQTDALINCSREMMSTHAYLLQKLTDELCDLIGKGVIA